MIVPSILPPLISAPPVVIAENVPAAGTAAPMIVPSILPPSISTAVDVNVLIVISLIVPPSTLSPEIWSSVSTRFAADTSTVSPNSAVRPAVTTPSFRCTLSTVTPASVLYSAIVSTVTVPENVASEPATALSNVMPAPGDSSPMLSTAIESIACEPIFRSASAVPTLNSQTSSTSFHCSDALSSVPRSTSIPAAPLVTPAAVSPAFSVIKLSATSVSVELTVVVVPVTVRSPFTIRFVSNFAFVSASVKIVVVSLVSPSSTVPSGVTLSSIPCDAKSEITPPSI